MIWFNVLTIFISGASAVAAYITLYRTRKWTLSSKENEMSKSLYQEFLLNKLPSAYDRFVVSQFSPNDGAEFSSTVKQFRQSVKYFKYTHKDVFQNISGAIKELEEGIANAMNNKPETEEDIEHAKKKMAEPLDKIYKSILIQLPTDRIEKYF